MKQRFWILFCVVAATYIDPSGTKLSLSKCLLIWDNDHYKLSTHATCPVTVSGAWDILQDITQLYTCTFIFIVNHPPFYWNTWDGCLCHQNKKFHQVITKTFGQTHSNTVQRYIIILNHILIEISFNLCSVELYLSFILCPVPVIKLFISRQ